MEAKKVTSGESGVSSDEAAVDELIAGLGSEGPHI